MKFEDFENCIANQIHVYATMQYGNPATGYLNVLIIDHSLNTIKSIGEIAYYAYESGDATVEILEMFGKECEDYLLGLRVNPPSCHYDVTGTLKIF